MNASAAHPLGANFLEILNITSLKQNRHRLTNKLVYSAYGIDQNDSISFGQNIFASYTLRPENYGHHLFQGVRTAVLNEELIYEYEILLN